MVAGGYMGDDEILKQEGLPHFIYGGNVGRTFSASKMLKFGGILRVTLDLHMCKIAKCFAR